VDGSSRAVLGAALDPANRSPNVGDRHLSARFDCAVIGGGIVGLATTHALHAARPDLSLLVLEKEPEVAAHQTGRNSGVIHAGLYYAPGSLKARLSVRGGPRLFEFCAEYGVATTQTGKIVVATSADQIPALDELERRATANGVETQRIGPAGIAEHEPHVRGIDGLRVPSTGAVDFGDVARAFAGLLSAAGVEIRTSFEVERAVSERGCHRLLSHADEVSARLVINCAGLHVDRISRILGVEPGFVVLPFRGEYWSLTEAAARRVRGHVYPVPDPRFPHLGVHFTRSVRDRVEIGPNAVWAWGREAYGRISGRPADALETLRYRGFWNLARAHWRTAAAEQWRSLSRRAFVGRARAMLPDLAVGDLANWRSGIRAQAVARDGSLVKDFVIRETPGVINVLNAPSPAATSCLTIGEHIAGRALEQLD